MFKINVYGLYDNTITDVWKHERDTIKNVIYRLIVQVREWLHKFISKVNQ